MAVFVWATGVIPTTPTSATAVFTINNRTVETQSIRAILWNHNSSAAPKTLGTQTVIDIPSNTAVQVTLGAQVDDYEVEVRLPSEHMDVFGVNFTGLAVGQVYRPFDYFLDSDATENP